MKLLLKNISMSLTFAVLKAYNKRKSPLREATMQIHAAAPKHREMPMGSTGFIGLRFNLMQLGISLRCMELKLNEWDICFFIYSFARLARNFLLYLFIVMEVVVMDSGPLPDNLCEKVNIICGAIAIAFLFLAP